MPIELNCPKCVGKLSLQTITHNEIYRDPVLKGEGLETEIEYYQCFVCQGVWLDSNALEEILAEKAVLIHTADPIVGASLDGSTGKPAACPRCGFALIRKGAPHDDRVLCDYCSKCRGIWLDSGKIDRIENDNLNLKDRFLMLLKNLSFDPIDRDMRRLG